MPFCIDCRGRFVGRGERCPICADRARPNGAAAKPVTPAPPQPGPVTQRDAAAPAKSVNVTRRDSAVTLRDSADPQRKKLEAERLELMTRLAEINRVLGPMTASERQRRSRARRRVPAQPG